MPVNVHDVAYNARPTFLWQKVEAAPQYRHPEMADYSSVGNGRGSSAGRRFSG